MKKNMVIPSQLYKDNVHPSKFNPFFLIKVKNLPEIASQEKNLAFVGIQGR